MARYLAISLTLSNGNGGSAPYFLCYNSRMGSGKGKARRVQTASVKAVSATATIPRTKYDRRVWSQFVKDSELKSLSLREYYLGSYENPNPKTWGYLTEESVTVDGSLKILTELFADAVDVGAIILPPPYNAADFEFAWDHSSTLGRVSPHFFVSLTDKSCLPVSFEERANSFFSPLWRMGDTYADTMLGEIASALTNLTRR